MTSYEVLMSQGTEFWGEKDEMVKTTFKFIFSGSTNMKNNIQNTV
jgi:hypothetical protein